MTVAAILIAAGIILLVAGIKGLSVWSVLLAKPAASTSGSLLQ